MEEQREWIKKEAKIEQKSRVEEQVEQVRKKLQKWADATVFGYSAPQKDYKEGDVWEDSDGKTWTIKDGIRQTVSKIDYSQIRMPWWCPKCGRTLNHKLHEKFYRLRGACHDCVVKWEGKMRVDGVWEIYERRVMRNNEKDWLKDLSTKHREYIDKFVDPQLYFSDGRSEKLADKELFTAVFEKLEKDIKFIELRLQQIQIEEKEDEENYKKLELWEQENPWSTKPDGVTT